MRRITVIKHSGTAICGYCDGAGKVQLSDFTRVDIDGTPTLADRIARIICDFESHAPGRLALSKGNCELADEIVAILETVGR